MRGHILEDGPLKYLGVLANINNSYDDLYQALEGRVAQYCELVNRATASGVTKATVAQASVLRSIEYAAVWENWSLEKYRKLNGLFTELLKTAARNMRSHPALALYMSRETMGQGFLRFQMRCNSGSGPFCNGRRWGIKTYGILDRACWIMWRHGYKWTQLLADPDTLSDSTET